MSSIILIPALLAITACAPSIDTLVERSLADSVENAQDDLWSYREQVIADPDAAITSIDFVSDARPIYDDPTYDMGEAQYVLLATSSSPGEAIRRLGVQRIIVSGEPSATAPGDSSCRPTSSVDV